MSSTEFTPCHMAIVSLALGIKIENLSYLVYTESEVIRKGSIRVKQKVFDQNDVLRFIEVIHSNFEKKSKNNEFKIELQVTDNSSYEFTNEYDREKIETILNTKRIVFVGIWYKKHTSIPKMNSELSVSISHGGQWDYSGFGGYFYHLRGDNSISITSDDETWYNAKFAELKECLDDTKDQTNPYLKHRSIIKPLVAIAMGYVVVAILVAFASYIDLFQIDSTPSTKWENFLYTYKIPVTLVVSWLVGFVVSIGFIDKLDSLWPNIEFNFGPKHLNINRLRRQIWAYIVTTLGFAALPYIFDVLF